MRTIQVRIMILVAALLLTTPAAGAASKPRSLCEIGYPSDSRIQWSCRKLTWSDKKAAPGSGRGLCFLFWCVS